MFVGVVEEAQETASASAAVAVVVWAWTKLLTYMNNLYIQYKASKQASKEASKQATKYI